MRATIQVQVPAPPGAAAASGKGASLAALRHAAQEFEPVFLAQVLSRLNQGLAGDEQTPFHDIFNDELAKSISRSGGVGVADAVMKEMLKSQEVA